MLRDLEFLDHEADRFVRQQVGARYGFEGGLDRPIPWDYDRISDYHLAILRHDLIATRQAAYAYNTQSAHFQHWKTYAKFCKYFDLQMASPDAETVCLFTQFLARSFKATQSIMNYVASVKL